MSKANLNQQHCSTAQPEVEAAETQKKQTYGIIGHNIAYSVSPQMHTAAYKAFNLPHEYLLIDVPTVKEFINGDVWSSESFGGCSVTIPHKLDIIPHLDELSPAAKEIGSVNTVIVQRKEDGGRKLYGDNTDWTGVYKPLKSRLSGDDGGCALILGGGGTARAVAYAIKQLGLERFYHNRTPSKAHDLAATFDGTVVDNLSEEFLGKLLDGKQLKVVISTLPAGANFELPPWIFDRFDKKPIVFDVNYKPYYTKLLTQAEENGCEVVRGSEMLWEQGVGQFELWMGRSAPRDVMKNVVLENCLPKKD